MTRAAPSVTESQLTRAFRALAEEHAASQEAATREQSWRLLRSRQQRLAPAPLVSRRLWFGFAAALLVAGLALVLWPKRALDYELSGGSAEDRIVRTSGDAATLSFSDGSTIEALPQTTLAVNIVGRHKALTRLSRGELKVRVKHDADTDWRFVAGPYELRVIGTAFDLAFEPAGNRLSVVMREGELLVGGENRPTQPLRAGQILVWQDPAPMSTSVAAAPAAPTLGAAPAPAAGEDSMPGNLPSAKPSAASFAELVAKGRFDEVVVAANQAGVEPTLSTKSSSELHALAQAARYTGNTALAARSWQALRRRFPGQSSSSQAAFFLARLYDEQGKAALALEWFDRYLAEAPSGVYAPDALGRKLPLVQRLQGSARAKKLAREYLARFPEGSYRQTARDMLARE